MTLTMVPGPRMPDEERARHWEALFIFRDAREAFDAAPVIDLFAPDGIYEAQEVENPLVGREAISGYLRERFAFFAELARTRDTGRLIPGLVDLPAYSDHPCLIFEAEGERQALWVLTLAGEGLIARLDILTVAPPPSFAREVSVN